MRALKNLLKRVLLLARDSIVLPYLNMRFVLQYGVLRNKRKIVYALTPPASLKNIGDHAQVVAIHGWFRKHFPELPVLEIDKNQSRELLPALKILIRSSDVIFLHSGGNLGDRGLWSERARRLLIRSFPSNRIVSLPQTIYFSDTPTGRQEAKTSREIYSTHPNLIVIGRDPRSTEIAAELFPKARTFSMPDFVLSLPQTEPTAQHTPPKVLLCLRKDNESILDEEQKARIAQSMPNGFEFFDTTIELPIEPHERAKVLESTLKLFSSFDAVVTDRYHGLIFAVICRKPCVVIPTVDHKLKAAMQWFDEIKFVALSENFDDIARLIEHCIENIVSPVPDWNAEYFDRLPHLIGLDSIMDVAKSTEP